MSVLVTARQVAPERFLFECLLMGAGDLIFGKEGWVGWWADVL